MKYSQKEIKEAKQSLKQSIEQDGGYKKLVIMITKVAKSGMSRRMKVYLPFEHGLSNITYDVARACELSQNDDGLLITGCGMDMSFWLANHLTYCLYGRDTDNLGLKGNGGGCLDWQCIY